MSRMRVVYWCSVVIATVGSFAGIVAWANADQLFPLERKIAVTITPNAVGCSSDTPLGLRVTNNSSKTITQTDFSWSSRLDGYSKAIGWETGSTDKIIAPGEQFELCLAKPGDQFRYESYPDKQLVYSVDVKHVYADPT